MEFAQTFCPEEDVPGDAYGKDDGLLKNHPDALAQRIGINGAVVDFLPVKEDFPGDFVTALQFQQSIECPQKGALSGTGRSDDAKDLAGHDF